MQLDETSRALLKKLLDDATRQALQKQAKVICSRTITCKLRHLSANFMECLTYRTTFCRLLAPPPLIRWSRPLLVRRQKWIKKRRRVHFLTTVSCWTNLCSSLSFHPSWHFSLWWKGEKDTFLCDNEFSYPFLSLILVLKWNCQKKPRWSKFCLICRHLRGSTCCFIRIHHQMKM